MKKLLTILLLMNVNFIYAQLFQFPENIKINFEDTNYKKFVFIDTIAYPHNTWQIGKPKHTFINANMYPKAIITDSINPYPTNNHSIFYIRGLLSPSWGVREVSGIYNVQSDSLLDYGSIEFSPNNGKTWIDIINDTNYKQIWEYPNWKPVLTGNSHGWKGFVFNPYLLYNKLGVKTYDTIIYRFKFQSDSIPDSLAGLMFDYINFSTHDGISPVIYNPLNSKVYPDPSPNNFTIEFDNPTSDIFQLIIYNLYSKPVLTKENIKGNKILITAPSLKPGTYIYKLSSPKAEKISWGKIIITN